jgi:hypothetical protein
VGKLARLILARFAEGVTRGRIRYDPRWLTLVSAGKSRRSKELAQEDFYYGWYPNRIEIDPSGGLSDLALIYDTIRQYVTVEEWLGFESRRRMSGARFRIPRSQRRVPPGRAVPIDVALTHPDVGQAVTSGAVIAIAPGARYPNSSEVRWALRALKESAGAKDHVSATYLVEEMKLLAEALDQEVPFPARYRPLSELGSRMWDRTHVITLFVMQFYPTGALGAELAAFVAQSGEPLRGRETAPQWEPPAWLRERLRKE